MAASPRFPNRPRAGGGLLRAGFLAVALTLPALPALAGKAPFRPSGTLLEGTERLPGIGRTPVSLHLGPDGAAAAAFVDPGGLAVAWTGTWSFEEPLLTLDLDPVGGFGSPVAVSLVVKGNGKGRGTVTRHGTQDLVTRLKVKAIHPAPKPRGWTVVVPRCRNDGGTAAGSLRTTLVLRNLAPASKKKKAAEVEVRVLGASGLPGRAQVLEIPPGKVERLAGNQLPFLPPGVEETALQFVLSGRRGLDPATLSVIAFEEVLRGPSDPATSGTPLPVRWVKAVRKKEAAARDLAPLAAPWFRDDGGSGALPRDALLVLRDLSPFSGDPDAGSVRVSVRTPAGAEVASSTVDLPRGRAVTLRPRDLLGDPGDLPGGVGQIRVTRADGSGILRNRIAAALSSTVLSGATPVATLCPAIEQPPPPGSAARLVVPYLYAEEDGSASARVTVGSLSTTSASLDVSVLDLAGNLLHAATVPVAAGEAVGIDPGSLGMDLSLLPGGEAQIVVGGAGGLPENLFVADGEGRVAGAPDTFFPGPVGFERALAPGDPVAAMLLDGLETLGSDAGDRDCWIFARNGGGTPLVLDLRTTTDGLPPAEGDPFRQVTVAPGQSLRISLEETLAAVGDPLDPEPDAFRGTLDLQGTAAGPLAFFALQFRRSATGLGGYAVPVRFR